MVFADDDKFTDLPIPSDARVLILRMHDVPTVDANATRTLFRLLESCEEKGIELLISHLNSQPKAVLARADFLEALGEDRLFSNVDEALARARELTQAHDSEKADGKAERETESVE
jgi:SulP family sulfate permease